MKKLLAVTIYIVLSCLSSFGQSINLTGTVSESVIEGITIPVSNALIKVTTDSKSYSTHSKASGSFTIKGIEKDHFTLSITADGYHPFNESISAVPGNNVVVVELQRNYNDTPGLDGGNLNGATVSARAPIVKMKGDTISFDPTVLADMLIEGDYSIEALFNMPGITVEDGSLFVLGERVQRTYVNGALIFGFDALAPFENIKADQFIALDVYDEDKNIKVANMKTKEPIFAVFDAQALLAGGSDTHKNVMEKYAPRFNNSFQGNFYSELKALSAEIYDRNIPLTEYENTPRALSSESESRKISLLVEKYWKSRFVGNSLIVRYNNQGIKNQTDSRKTEEIFPYLDQPKQVIIDTAHTEARNTTHVLQSALSLSELKYFQINWNNDLQFSGGRNSQRDISYTYNGTPSPIIQGPLQKKEDQVLGLHETVTIIPKDVLATMIPNFTISVDREKKKVDEAIIDTLEQSTNNRNINTQYDYDSKKLKLEASQRFVLKAKKKTSRLGIDFTVRYTYDHRDERHSQEGFEPLPGAVIKSSNSTFDYRSFFTTNTLALSSRINFTVKPTDSRNIADQKILSINPSLAINRADVLGDEQRLDSDYSKRSSFWGIMPAININFFNIGSIHYAATQIVPTYEQLRPFADDRHQYSISAGNPDLKPSRTHSLTSTLHRGQFTSSLSAIHWRVSSTTRYTIDPILSSSRYISSDTWLGDYSFLAPAGATLRTYRNADYQLSSSLSAIISTSVSIGRLIPKFTLEGGIDYSDRPNMFQDAIDRTLELRPQATFSTELNVSRALKLKGSSRVSVNNSKTRSGEMQRSTLTGISQFSIKTLPSRLTFFDLDYYLTQNRSISGGNIRTDKHELNVSAGISLLKQSLNINLSVIDLLGKNGTYTETMNEHSFTQTWYPSFGRYFLVGIKYRFNHASKNNIYQPQGYTRLTRLED